MFPFFYHPTRFIEANFTRTDLSAWFFGHDKSGSESARVYGNSKCSWGAKICAATPQRFVIVVLLILDPGGGEELL